MAPIVNTKDEVKFGLHRRLIFGLNILAANRVKLGDDEDPRLLFLRGLCAEHSCSAHTGNLNELALTPEEMFGPPGGENRYVLPGIGVYDGTFYDVSSWPNFPACLFPEVKSSFWEARNLDGSAGVREVLNLDALAMYVSPIDEAAVETLTLLSREGPPTHEGWLRLVTGLYSVALIVDNHGGYFSAFSRDESHFDLLSPALSRAVKSVEDTPWYHGHADSLRWDGEYNTCLMLPELMRKVM